MTLYFETEHFGQAYLHVSTHLFLFLPLAPSSLSILAVPATRVFNYKTFLFLFSSGLHYFIGVALKKIEQQNGCSLLSPCSTVILEKLTVAHLFKKHPKLDSPPMVYILK
jgi:hypothetical protein